jgi:hypothetical protein
VTWRPPAAGDGARAAARNAPSVLRRVAACPRPLARDALTTRVRARAEARERGTSAARGCAGTKSTLNRSRTSRRPAVPRAERGARTAPSSAARRDAATVPTAGRTATPPRTGSGG